MTEAAPAADATADDERRVVPFEFTGTAGEYFRIWIVNIVLTVLTLGIYSAWAKVRSYRYLHGSTWLDGRSFEYTARPITILKGRIIAVSAFVVWYVASTFFPLVALLLLPPLLAAAPWVIVRSLKFRSFHTRYRNLRFNFSGTYGQAAIAYLLWPFLALISAGLLWPFFAYKAAEFSWDNLGFGDRRFSFFGEVGPVYRIYLMLLGALIGMGLVLLLFAFGLFSTVEFVDETDPSAAAGPAIVAVSVAVYLLSLLVYVFPPAYLKARLGNYVLNNVNAGGSLPVSSMQVHEVYWIYLSNLLAIVFTIGLAIPWATIRMARYRAGHTMVTIDEDLAAIGAGDHDRVAATGEELGEVFDFDIGF